VSTTQHVSRRRHVTADHVVSPANPASGGFLTAMGAGRAINLSREERQVGVKAAPSLNQSRRTPYCCRGVVGRSARSPLDARHHNRYRGCGDGARGRGRPDHRDFYLPTEIGCRGDTRAIISRTVGASFVGELCAGYQIKLNAGEPAAS
jgi:hypothetical protein